MKQLRFVPGLFIAALMLPEISLAESLLSYPETAMVAVVDTAFGEKVADPYRWLEADVRNDPKVRDWVTAQNKLSGAYLAALPGRDKLEKRLRDLFSFERMGVPFKAGSRYFYARNTGLQNQSTLWVREGAGGTERLLIDPNTWVKDGAAALAEWLPTDDGRLLAYTVQDGGTDWRTVRVIDATTGNLLDDEVHWVKFSRLAWMRDSSGFFYSRFPEPKAGETFQQLNLNQSIWFHAIGTPQSADVQIFATPAMPKLNHSAEVTDDGRWLVISSSAGTDPRNAVTLVSLAKPGAKPRSLIPGIEHDWQLVGAIGNQLWFRTDMDAPKGRIVRLDVSARNPKPVPIVPEERNTLVGASMVGTHLIVAYLGDAKSQAERFTLDGKAMGPVELPGIGTAAGFGGKYGERESFYSFSGFATAPSIYRFDSETNRSEPFFTPKVAFDSAGYVTEQVFFPSKDGTAIPMFVVKRRDLAKGAAPTLLYGYGGFNVSLTPSFSATRIAWLEQGGVLAVANLRGGGEYGKEWHDAGRLARKQNVFDDFIAAGEYLITKGVTAKDKLAIQGGSNGGLLVGAVVNQRPDLFAAALPAVGVMDMLRFDQFTAGRYWVDDYGNPSVEADWRLLRNYSPYHNIRSGVDYPAVLVTTADTDDRVVPGHSFKYTAALQAAKVGPKPHIIRIETRAGHGSGKPTDKIIESAADEWAFIAKWTGLTVK